MLVFFSRVHLCRICRWCRYSVLRIE